MRRSACVCVAFVLWRALCRPLARTESALTSNDWRHTYAVNNLQAGMKPQLVKRQLGHAKNSTMVERIYGVWIVDEKDCSRPAMRVVR